MQKQSRILSLTLPFRMGKVNCYLIETSKGYILIDTGGSNNRKELVRELDNAGCKPGLLKLIVLTHGDFDHSGNAAFLHTAFGGKIAMHPDDSGIVSHGDMFVNPKKPNLLIRMMLSLFFGLGRSDRFSPDFLLEDGENLSKYGIDAQAISIPGHSKRSIGILIDNTDFFCGDLLVNLDKPELNSLIDDLEAAHSSLQKLKSMNIKRVYPGHGKPFPMNQIIINS